MVTKEKTVYTVMGTDSIHAGHMNIINESKKYGKLVVGVLTDEAIASFKRVPAVPYDLRKKTIENIKGVDEVIPQYTLDYTENLRKLKPDIVTNGDDWREGVQKETRQKVIEVLKEWGGELIEIPYTKGISPRLLIEDFRQNGVTPEQRLNMLRRLINVKPIVRVIEAHGGLSALVAENAEVEGKEFDAIWESSLTDSSSKGKPDIELVDFTSRAHTINEIIDVTTKPIIVDGDTGGLTEHFVFMVKTLERLGVSAVIIEDKIYRAIGILSKSRILSSMEFLDLLSAIRLGVDMKILSDIETTYLNANYNPPGTTELAEQLKLKESKLREYINILRERDVLVVVSDQYLYHKNLFLKLVEAIREFYKYNSEMKVSDLKEISGTTRKHAIPLLTFLDDLGITRREGDVRLPGSKISDF